MKENQGYQNSTEQFQMMLDEYNRYSLDTAPPNNDFLITQMFRKALNNINQFPTLKKLDQTLQKIYQEDQIAELRSVGPEEFGEMFNRQFKTKEEALNFISNELTSEYGIEYSIEINGFEGFLAQIGNYVDTNQLLKEFYQNMVFPVWYNHWKEQDIDKTRKQIEQIYKALYKSTSLNDLMTHINLALNISHVTGPMLDYLENDTGSDNLKKILDSLSQGEDIPKWNKELKMVGVKI